MLKDNTQLDRKFKIKHGTKWELVKRINKSEKNGLVSSNILSKTEINFN